MKAVNVESVDDVKVRKATVDDVAELADLRRTFTFEDATEGEALRSDYEESFASIVTNGLESGRWVIWVAEAAGAIVSHAFVGTIEKIPRPVVGHRAIGYLTNVYTRREFRGHGIGGRVLDAVAAWALEADIELLIVWPSEASFGHYERHGFAVRGEPLVWLQSEDPA